MPHHIEVIKNIKKTKVNAQNKRCLDLPERPKLPERPPKYGKYQRIIGKH